MSNSQEQTKRQLEVLDIMKNFNFHPKLSNPVLESYTKRKGYEFISAGEYQDHLYQYMHDQRCQELIPQILEALQSYHYVPDYVGETKKRQLRAENQELEMRISKLCEDAGISYREIDIVTKNFAAELGATIESAGTRMNNMCALVVSVVAQKQFGEHLLVKDLATYHREITGEV